MTVAYTYQTCPKCSGSGTVSTPPWVAEGVLTVLTDSTSFTCPMCKGMGKILSSQKK